MRKYEHRLQTREQQQKFKEELTEMLLNIQIENLKRKNKSLTVNKALIILKSYKENENERTKFAKHSLHSWTTSGCPHELIYREVQESIVDNYFNGTGSVYANTVDNYNRQFRPQQSAATEPAQTQQSVAQQDTPQLSADEIASLTKIKRMIDGNPNILNEIARRELSQGNQQQNTQSQTTVPAEGSNSFAPNNVSKNEPSSADLWDQLFSQNESVDTARCQYWHK